MKVTYTCVRCFPPRGEWRVGNNYCAEHLALVRQGVRTSQAVGAAKNRAKRYGVLNTLTTHEWREILEKSEGRCFYCKKEVGVESLGPDHVVPLSKGGPNSVDNIVAACFMCNCKKGARAA